MVNHSMIPAENELIQKRPLKDDIFDILHDKIVSGKYKPGQWLRQDDIATQLGVSMTPVREAFDLLVASGLAERVAYRGVRVREISTKDIVEAYGLRLFLEVLIAEEAARKITPEQVAGLERTIAEMKKHDNLKDVSVQRRLSREFHAAIADVTKNDLLIKLYGVVSNAFPDWLLYEALFRYPEILHDTMTSMHTEHTAMVDALKKRDGLKAALKSVEHVMESGQWLVDYLNIPAELLREKEEQVLSLLKKTSK
jgi:GntR family transcriptional regulator, rspAB operon transcriptional repressor